MTNDRVAMVRAKGAIAWIRRENARARELTPISHWVATRAMPAACLGAILDGMGWMPW